MAQLFGVCLLPASGEFVYDTLPARAAHWLSSGSGLGPFAPINCYYAAGGSRTDYSYALDRLQAEHPECTTVALVCAWFGDSTNATNCNIYPSCNYIGGAFSAFSNGGWTSADWQVSGLMQSSSGLIPISAPGGAATYGGTPSDQSIVRCIRDLRARNLRVVFYPFILMDAPGKPWRGRITLSSDLSVATTTAVNNFLGSAAPSQFLRDPANLTVNYSGSPTDYTFRRFILHYANLCVIAGGVDLFLLGSELRGLEILRGPNWTRAGTLDPNGHAVWDYPFVAGLIQLAADVRATFDSAGLTKNLTTYNNLIAYSPDWSSWNGWQHADANGQWPHLDSLFASPNIDLVSFDNYLPLSDWTLDGGGLDCANWNAPRPQSWPPSSKTMNGLALSGSPTLYSAAYLQANIEGGEGFNWYYEDSNSGGLGLDPLGSDQRCTLPQGDRLAQARKPYSPNQQLLARKALRWWWNNSHQAIYDAGDGLGWAPHGATTQWMAQSKPIAFVEYGFASVDRCTNQPNVFFDVKSAESGTPFWSLWQGPYGDNWLPKRDDGLADLALQTVHDYWSAAPNMETSSAGVPVILTPFCCAWNWDARPFPAFPLLAGAWSDGGNWATGNWIDGKGPAIPPPVSQAHSNPGIYATFPILSSRGWGVKYAPRFSTRILGRVSGRETRAARMSSPLYDIELTFDLLRDDADISELQQVMGFVGLNAGQAGPFLFAPPSDLSAYWSAPLGIGDGATTAYQIRREIGGFEETAPALIGAPTVYLNGVALAATSYSVSILPATITFLSAPAPGAVLAVDFVAAHLARFVSDSEDLEQFMRSLWRSKSIKLETVRI
jgi:uncharacterized protein (TIGR02217 family)